MARGRKPHDESTRAAVLALRGLSLRKISRMLAEQGIIVSPRSVGYILSGKKPKKDPTLAPGERRVKKRRCPKCGGMIVIVPCRGCKAARAKLDKLVDLRKLSPGNYWTGSIVDGNGD